MPPSSTAAARPLGLVRRLFAKAGLGALVWVVLTDGDLRNPVLSVAIILLAVASGLAAPPPEGRPLRLRGLVRFVPFFLSSSIAGGLDVALRAYRPSRPLDPELVRFRSRLPRETSAAVFFIDLINLLPGTLCAGIEDRDLLLHVVDRRQRFEERLRALEERVAELFDEPLAEES
jgi:multicomponent Na+:H+ antiporter subunit E